MPVPVLHARSDTTAALVVLVVWEEEMLGEKLLRGGFHRKTTVADSQPNPPFEAFAIHVCDACGSRQSIFAALLPSATSRLPFDDSAFACVQNAVDASQKARPTQTGRVMVQAY